jgi:U6 snRNA-associated Sm-like protein LSm1
VPLGLYILRGENVILLGEIDPNKDPPELLSRVSKDVISRAVKAEKEQDKLKAGMASRFDFLED